MGIVTGVFVGGGGGASGPVSPLPTSARSKLRSELLAEFWCTSTAITLSPAYSVGVTGRSRYQISSFRLMAVVARVAEVTEPCGMLLRATSTPLTYTIAPSSRRIRTVID